MLQERINQSKFKILSGCKDCSIHDLFHHLKIIFSFFYAQKVKLKKGSFEKWVVKEYDEILKKEKEIEELFKKLEDYELFYGVKFKDIEGNDLLRRTKAQFLHTKRFFKKIKTNSS